MNDARYGKLLETSWRRKLSGDEEAELRAWLAAHPEDQPSWEIDAALSDALRRLPDEPVPGNFTARVLQAVERGTGADANRGARRPEHPWRFLLPRAAFAALSLSACFVAYHVRQLRQQEALAQSVAAVSQVASLPSPDILRDFDAIRRLPPTPPPDDQLLALLK